MAISASFKTSVIYQYWRSIAYFDALYPFGHDRTFPMLPQKADIIPGPEQARIHLPRPDISEPHPLLDVLITLFCTSVKPIWIVGILDMLIVLYLRVPVQAHEGRIRRAHSASRPMPEGKIFFFEIVRAPANCRRIERHDESRKATLSCTSEDRNRDFRRFEPSQVYSYCLSIMIPGRTNKAGTIYHLQHLPRRRLR